ncbi:axin interactor, dorsalization-associated protein-like [Ictidomys tridecemlineatus]
MERQGDSQVECALGGQRRVGRTPPGGVGRGGADGGGARSEEGLIDGAILFGSGGSSRLARHLQKEAQAQHNNSEFTEEQKSTQSQEEFKLENLKKLEPILKNILTYNKEFPFDVQPVSLRRILAPGEEEHLEFEEDKEEGGAGAGYPNSFPARVPDLNGIDLTPVQDTPVASRKEDTYVHFNVDIELQKHIEKLTKGAAIFFEFKH